MSPTLQILLVAGIAFAGFILLGLIAWSIRIRRAEDGFEPAPPKPQKHVRHLPYTAESEQAVADWMGGTAKETAEPIEPSGQLIPDDDFGSPFKNLLRGAMPELSLLIELGKMVKESQGAEGTADTPEERKEAFRRAIDRMLEQNPDNAFLRQMRDSLPSEGGGSDEGAGDDRVRVFQVGGKTAIQVDGAEINSADDISDPELREKINKLLNALDDGE